MMELGVNEPAAKNRSGCLLVPFVVLWRVVKWGFVSLSTLAIVLMIWSVLDPPKPLLISRETTLITEPLAEDGLPDYARFVLDRQREGVTPENNGAIPFWKAMGPSIIDQEYREILFDEIGTPIPSGEGSLKKLSDDATLFQVGEWLASEWGNEQIDERARMDLADELIADARRHPWRDVAPAPLAAWVEENQASLDLLVESARKPKFYSPSPNLLLDPPDPLLMALLPDVQEIRPACRGLVVRAAHRIKKKDFKGAWHDLEATLLLSNHAASKDDLVSQMVKIACRDIVFDALNIWWQENKDIDQARLVLAYLQHQPEPFFLSTSFEFGESMMMIDACVRSVAPSRERMDEVKIDLVEASRRNRFDANAMLRYVRRWQDRLIEVANEKNRIDRRHRMSQLESDYNGLGGKYGTPGGQLYALLSREERSEAVAIVFVAYYLPASIGCLEAEERGIDELRLARIAAALAVRRLEQGDYPDRLEHLVPDLLPALPQDASWGKPFHYERRGEGYLLYAVGTDGEDNGGDNRDGTIIDGEWILDEESDKVTGGVDLVIRLPIPELRLPAPPE